jgi:hypothetical protein
MEVNLHWVDTRHCHGPDTQNGILATRNDPREDHALWAVEEMAHELRVAFPHSTTTINLCYLLKDAFVRGTISRDYLMELFPLDPASPGVANA